MGAEERRPERTSRRSLLAAAGGGAVALAGCRASRAPTASIPEFKRADADVLDGLLRMGNRAVAAYAGAAGLLHGAQRALARRIGVQEAAHVYALTGAIDRLGGNPAPAPPAYVFAPGDGAAALALAGEIEGMSIAACIDAMPKLSDLEARGTVVSMANSHAQHAVLIAQARGLPPIPNAIVRGRA